MQPLTAFEIVQLVVTLFAAPLGVVLWFMFRKLIADVASLTKSVVDGDSQLEKSLADYKLHASEIYITKNDLQQTMDSFIRSIDAIFTKLDRIEDKLDLKADKVK